MAKILLVDDEPDVAGLMSDWLRLRGYDVLRAADGLEALRMARSDGPDLILLDAFMPGLDGLETGRRLRAQPETRDMPIVLIAGEDAASAQVDRLMAGASDAVTRPVALEDLGRRLRALLEGKPTPENRGDALAREAVSAAVAGLPCQLAWLFGPGENGGWASLAVSAPGRPDALPAGQTDSVPGGGPEGWLSRVISTRIAQFNTPLDDLAASPDDPVIQACVRLGSGYVTLIPLTPASGATGALLLASREPIETDREVARHALLAATTQAGMAVERMPSPPVPLPKGEGDAQAALTPPYPRDAGSGHPSPLKGRGETREEEGHEGPGELADSGPEIGGEGVRRDGRPRFAALREATLAALNSSSLDNALQAIIGQTARAVNARLTAVLLRPQRGSETLIIHRAAGLRAKRLEDTSLPLAGSLAGEALRIGKPALFEPGSELKGEVALIEERTGAPIEAAAAAPLVVRGEGAGALLAAGPRGQRFDEDDTDLLQSLANLASIVIGGAHLAIDTEGRARGISILHRAAEASAAQPAPALLDSITRLVMDGLGTKSCAIRGWDRRSGELTTLARRVDYRGSIQGARSAPLREWPSARQAVDTGSVVRVSGNRQETRGGAGMHSLMLYPLPGGALAVLGHPAESQVFSEEHVGQCRDAAEDWLATHPGGLPGGAGSLAEALLDAVEAPWCVVYLLDPTGESLVRAAEIGHVSFGMGSPDVVPTDQASLRRATLGGKKTVAFTAGDERLSEADRAAASPFDAGVMLMTPIAFFGQAIGLLETADDNPARRFAEHDQLVLQAIASLIGGALGREKPNLPRPEPLRPDTEQAAPIVFDERQLASQIPDPPREIEPEGGPAAEEMPLQRTMASLENAARAAIDVEHSLAERTDVSLLPFYGEFLPDIYIDRGRVVQVFKILLENAIHASPDGGRITISIRQDGQMLHTEIVDHGPGIPASEQDKIWEKGRGATPAESRGLAWASLVIRAHGGRIWMVSQEGVGSTFAFSLPTAELSGMGDFIPSF